VIPDGNQALASLRSGEIDAFSLAVGTSAAPPQAVAGLKADPSLSYRDRPAGGPHALFFNETREPFGSRELRQAVSFAIDRAAIAHGVWFDTALPLDVIFSPAIWAFDDAYHPYLKRDVARAKQLLAQAGKPNGFAFSLLARNNPPFYQQGAELIKDQLRDAGIDVTIQLLEAPALQAALRAGEHQLGYQATGQGLDPDTWAYPYFSSKGAQNSFTHYDNPAVDRLLEEARTTLDPALFQGDVHQAYVAAERYPGILIQLHCYCGCDREIGHRSLLDCYRDRHATTCPICLGEALMAGRMTYEGKPIDQIREAIRARYAHGS